MAEAVYEHWDEIYRKKIIAEAVAEAVSEGKAELLIRQLTHRFGTLPKWAETRVKKAKSAQIEEWADAVLDASSLTEVIGTSARK